MNKIVAKLEHRDYVPWGWLAFKFSNLEFSGVAADEYERAWRDSDFCERKRKISLEEFHLNRSLKQKQEQLENIQLEKSEFEKYKPFFWHCIFRTKTWQIYLNGLNHLIQEMNTLTDIIQEKKQQLKDLDELDKKKFGQARIYYEQKKFLERQNFHLSQYNSHGDECVTITEIWVKEF